MLGITLGDDDAITLGIDEGTELGFSYGSFDFSNYGKLEGKFLGDSLRTDDGTELVSLDGAFYGYNNGNLMAQHLVYHWDLLMDLYLALMKASSWAHLMVKFWVLHF